MRYAVISDVHANFDALKAFQADAAQMGVEQIVCLGDIVGYGPQPAMCVDWVRRHCAVVVIGNHDAAVCGLLDTGDFIDLAADAVARHQAELSSADRAWLKALPFLAQEADFSVTHGDFTDPGSFPYVRDPDEAAACFACQTAVLSFVGHTHEPGIFVTGQSGRVYALAPTDFMLESGKRYIVNPGSIGYPRARDGQCLSSYVIYDSSAHTVRFRFLPFAVSSVLQRGGAGRAFRWRNVGMGVAVSLGLLGVVLSFVLRKPLPSPEPSETKAALPGVICAVTNRIVSARTAQGPGLRLKRGSAPVLLRVMFLNAARAPMAPAETILVKKQCLHAFTAPAGAEHVEFALIATTTNVPPKIESFGAVP